MPIERFWEYSIAEIQDYLESYERRERQRIKQSLSEKHFLAQDISQYVGLFLGGKKEELLELWDFFPGLFEEEGNKARESRQAQEMEVYKARMKDFANRHNHAKNGGEKP